jgi:hypothetical protein
MFFFCGAHFTFFSIAGVLVCRGRWFFEAVQNASLPDGRRYWLLEPTRVSPATSVHLRR